MSSDKDSKTEEPTAKRLGEARKQGQWARTQDAGAWMGVAAGTVMLPSAIGALAAEFEAMLQRLPEAAAAPEPEHLLRLVADLPWHLARVAGPLCLAAVGAALLTTALQGVHRAEKVVAFKASRLNPWPGVKRMFGVKALWEGAKALLKVAIVAFVVFWLAVNALPGLLGAGIPIGVVVERTRTAVMQLLWSAIAAGMVLAVADYGFQKRTTMRELRMSPREIKEEHKQTDGDPMVKGAIRQRAMAMSRNRMLQAVSTADVVVVNPTHVAVALKYAPDRGAPRVVAKGIDSLALKIKARARAARVPVVEDKPLARTLYQACDLDEEIPRELFLAVARILAFVMTQARPLPTDGPRRVRPSTVPALPTRAELKARRARERREARSAARALRPWRR